MYNDVFSSCICRFPNFRTDPRPKAEKLKRHTEGQQQVVTIFWHETSVDDSFPSYYECSLFSGRRETVHIRQELHNNESLRTMYNRPAYFIESMYLRPNLLGKRNSQQHGSCGLTKSILADTVIYYIATQINNFEAASNG